MEAANEIKLQRQMRDRAFRQAFSKISAEIVAEIVQDYPKIIAEVRAKFEPDNCPNGTTSELQASYQTN